MSRIHDKRTALGDFAENLVYDFLKNYKPTKFSKDVYDTEKDLIFNGYSVEVKARTKILKTPIVNTFAIEKSQWLKMDEAQIVIFVNIPMSVNEPINPYFLKNKKHFSNASFDGKEILRFYHIDKMQRIYTIDDYQTIKSFYDLNFSKFKK